MRFERVLGFYWVQSYLFNGQLKSPLYRPFWLITILKGLSTCSQKKLVMFMESDKFLFLRFSVLQVPALTYLDESNDTRVRVNHFFSRLSSLNYSYDEIFLMISLKKIFLKTYRGRSFFLKRPTRGQRTRSNWKNSKKMCGRGHLLKVFLNTYLDNLSEKEKINLKKYKNRYFPSFQYKAKKRFNAFFNF